MKHIRSLAAGAVLLAAPALAVEIEVAYPYGYLLGVTYEKIMVEFNKQHPDIDVKFRAHYENYEDATNTILREAVSGNLPDVTLQGLNRQAILVEKGIAKSLDPFIAQEADFKQDGYHDAMLRLSRFNNQIYGIPFAISMPIGYYNMDIMNKAGVATMPTTWDDVISACHKMQKIGIRNPVFWGWNITGNWFLQALLWSQGVPIIKDNKINFDGKAGLTAFETMKKIFRDCKMQNLSNIDSLSAFTSGEIGMMFTSTSEVGTVERTKSDFELKTDVFPGVGKSPIALPAGGNAALLVSTSTDPQRVAAAWQFIKFITSGIGAAAVAETTGYIPPNKAANELILADFYKRNPNKETAFRQLPLLRNWLAYPGANGLAITQVIYDGIEGIVVGETNDMKELQQQLTAEVSDLLPQ